MTKRGEGVRRWAFAAGVALLTGVALVAVPPPPTPTWVVSPDGSWAVEVHGSQYETTGFREGRYEMTAYAYDAQGRLIGSRQVGLAESHAAAERDFPVTFADDDTARVGGRTIRKADFIR
jgi:YD repeat-containing protein